jgi:hypothetical protein
LQRQPPPIAQQLLALGQREKFPQMRSEAVLIPDPARVAHNAHKFWPQLGSEALAEGTARAKLAAEIWPFVE